MHEINNKIGLVQCHCTMLQFKLSSGYSAAVKYAFSAGDEKLIKTAKA